MQACSGDMLLEALVACAGVTLKAVATALEIAWAAARCAPRATSIFAARSGSTARHRSASAKMRLAFALDTDEPQDRVDTLLKLTERYCVVCRHCATGPRSRPHHETRPAIAIGHHYWLTCDTK